jgi:hypothetical protein
LGSGLSPSGRPGMTFLGKNNFFTRSFAGEARKPVVMGDSCPASHGCPPLHKRMPLL